MKKTSAFTLMEIMIAVAILSVLVMLAIPNFLRTRMVSNETAALASLKTIYNACQLYYANNSDTYPSTLEDMSTSNPPYIDSVLAGGRKQGYLFVYSSADADHFTVNANPISPGRTGERYFYMNEAGTIHSSQSGAATADDPVVQ